MYLENTELLLLNNKKKKNQKGVQIAEMYTYELHMNSLYLEDVRINVSLFTLETIAEIISVITERLKKGIHKSVVFYSQKDIMPVDNLTVSMLEYVIFYYYSIKDVEIYVTQGELKNKFEFETCCILHEEKFLHNGFFCGSAGSGFLLTSFLLSWIVNDKGKHDINEVYKMFYLKNSNERRYKALIGKGPWDASIAISQCQEFLEKQRVPEEGIAAVMDVIGELAPNATEHGNTNCLIDLSCEDVEFPYNNMVKKGTNVSIVVFDFSKKLLGSDLQKKIFIDSEKNKYKYKIERINAVKKAWKYHKEHLNSSYIEGDFYNLIAFQRISGRKGDRTDGGLGISTLIKRVQQYTKINYCYVLSGNGSLSLDTQYTEPNEKGYIGFNMEKKFVDRIPDLNAVEKTKFYMPGVAYNLCFNFLED